MPLRSMQVCFWRKLLTHWGILDWWRANFLTNCWQARLRDQQILQRSTAVFEHYSTPTFPVAKSVRLKLMLTNTHVSLGTRSTRARQLISFWHDPFQLRKYTSYLLAAPTLVPSTSWQQTSNRNKLRISNSLSRRNGIWFYFFLPYVVFCFSDKTVSSSTLQPTQPNSFLYSAPRLLSNVFWQSPVSFALVCHRFSDYSEPCAKPIRPPRVISFQLSPVDVNQAVRQQWPQIRSSNGLMLCRDDRFH